MNIYILYLQKCSASFEQPQARLITTDLDEVSECLKSYGCVDHKCRIENTDYWIWMETVKSPNERMTLPQGELYVCTTDPNYPGMEIGLELQGGTLLPLVLIESVPDSGSTLSVYTYGDAVDDEYTNKTVIRNLEVMLEE